jgi:hypothetical protein
MRTAAAKFVTAWVAANGKPTKGVYLHMLVAHVPDMIKRFGDLRLYQVQGLEHCHSIRKRLAVTLTNKKPGKPGGERARTEQMMGQIICMDYVLKQGAQHVESVAHLRIQEQRHTVAARRIKKGKYTMYRQEGLEKAVKIQQKREEQECNRQDSKRDLDY